MANETVIVFIIIGITAVLMMSSRVRFDLVALLVVLALILSGVLTVNEALAGFGSPVLAMVAGLLVLGEMLSRTGVARKVGDWVLRRGGHSETRLLVMVMGGAALLGSVMSSTAVVALFIPIVMRIASETRLNASRMLIPLSYTALISGMLTLIATPPNIVVHEQLKSAGYQGFGFFSFSLLGLAVLAVCILYVLIVGRRLLGPKFYDQLSPQLSRSIEDIWLEYSPGNTCLAVRVEPESELVGVSVKDSRFSSYNTHIVGILQRRRGRRDRVVFPLASTELVAGAILVVVGRPIDVERLTSEKSLTLVPACRKDKNRWLWDISAAAIQVQPKSRLLDSPLRESELCSTYGVQVLGMRRNSKVMEGYEGNSLHPSDNLFVVGAWASIQQLSQNTDDFVLIEIPREHRDRVPSPERLRMSLLIIAGMVLLAVFNVVPLVAAVLMASIAAVVTRCLTVEDAYRSIHWGSLILVAGMLPLAHALDKTGGTGVEVDSLMSLMGEPGPYRLMTMVFFLTATIGLLLPNLASALLMSPVAIYAASVLNASPYPFAVAVVIAASSSFSTPVATPVVSLVVLPGRYQFVDFIKAGLPLLFLTYCVTMIIAPRLFPFFPA